MLQILNPSDDGVYNRHYGLDKAILAILEEKVVLDREVILTSWLEKQSRIRRKLLDLNRGKLPKIDRQNLKLICHFHKLKFFGETLLLEAGVVDWHHPPKGAWNVNIPCLFFENKVKRMIRPGYHMINHRFMLNPYHPGRLKSAVPQVDCLEFVDNNGNKIRPEIWSVLPFDPVINQYIFEKRMTDSSWNAEKSLYQILKDRSNNSIMFRLFQIIRDSRIPVEYAIPPYWEKSWKRYIKFPNKKRSSRLRSFIYGRGGDIFDEDLHLNQVFFETEVTDLEDGGKKTELFLKCGLTGSKEKKTEIISGKNGNSIKHFSSGSKSSEDNSSESSFEAHSDPDGRLTIEVDRRPLSSSGLSFGYKAGYLIDPETGTRSNEPCVIKLEIDNREGRVSFNGRETKIRAEKVRVVAMAKIHQDSDSRNIMYEFCHPSNMNGISDFEIAFGYVYDNFQYRLGDEIEIQNYNPDLAQVCVPGIHFFWTQLGVLDFISDVRTPLENEIINSQEMDKIDLKDGMYTLNLSHMSSVRQKLRESIEYSNEVSSSKSIFGDMFEEKSEETSDGSGSSSSECPICLTSFSEAEVSITPCQHRFHESCLAEVYHYDYERKCPICRNRDLY